MLAYIHWNLDDSSATSALFAAGLVDIFQAGLTTVLTGIVTQDMTKNENWITGKNDLPKTTVVGAMVSGIPCMLLSIAFARYRKSIYGFFSRLVQRKSSLAAGAFMVAAVQPCRSLSLLVCIRRLLLAMRVPASCKRWESQGYGERLSGQSRCRF